MSSSLVTVAIPTYNGAAYLAETLSRVLAQTYSNIEVLVVDDVSKDETVAIVQQFAAKDNRIRLVQNEVNLGLVGNWNRCIDLARGEWIKFCFQDNHIEPCTITVMMEAAKTMQQSFVICHRTFLIADDAVDWLKDYYRYQLIKLEDYFKEDTVVNTQTVGDLVKKVGLFENLFGEPSTYLFHKNLVKQYGYFNKDLAQLCDYEFALRISSNEGFAFVAKSLATFRVHGGSESSRNQEQQKIKLQYVDTLLMLHQFLYDAQYANFRHNFSVTLLRQRYQLIYNSLLERLGKSSATILLKPYFKRYVHLKLLKYHIGLFLWFLPKRLYQKLRHSW